MHQDAMRPTCDLHPDDAKWGSSLAAILRRAAFTLIELLVVIAIISILAVLLWPTLVNAKEQARRAACKNHVRQFIIAFNMYGDDHNQWLPTGASEVGPLDDHIPVVRTNTRKAIIQYSGSYKMLDCPSLGKPFTQPDGCSEYGYGVILGYNCLGDTPTHPGHSFPAAQAPGSRLGNSRTRAIWRW